ncbi:MAG: hypothetical protein KJ697_01870 [Nanoarchaeota archaeon]|nr:hypothetical protein [Nanoarchaeota archaeon]MBU4123902.1 hypothetical protein [Nanoarchaeota archaeon]
MVYCSTCAIDKIPDASGNCPVCGSILVSSTPKFWQLYKRYQAYKASKVAPPIPIPASTPGAIICPSCGGTNPASNITCNNCGYNFKTGKSKYLKKQRDYIGSSRLYRGAQRLISPVTPPTPTTAPTVTKPKFMKGTRDAIGLSRPYQWSSNQSAKIKGAGTRSATWASDSAKDDEWECSNPKCKTKNIGTDLTCAACGWKKQSATKHFGKVCPYCGELNQPGEDSCITCGVRIAHVKDSTTLHYGKSKDKEETHHIDTHGWIISSVFAIAGFISMLLVPIVGFWLGIFLIAHGISELPNTVLPKKPKVGEVWKEDIQDTEPKTEGWAALVRMVLNVIKATAIVGIFYTLNPALGFFAALVVYLAYPVHRVSLRGYEGAERMNKEAQLFYSKTTILGKFIMVFVLAGMSFIFATSGGAAMFTVPLLLLIIGFFIVGGFGELLELWGRVNFEYYGDVDANTGKIDKPTRGYGIWFYLITAICCLFALMIGVASFNGDALYIYVLVVGMEPIYLIIAFISRAKLHPKSLPMIGVMVFFTVFALLSIGMTGTVGQTLFGNYWPTVEHYGAMVVTPIVEAYDQVSEGMNDAWLMMSCPTCYAQKQMDKQKVTATRVKEGGVKKSIELTEFKAINYGTGTPTIDPSIPLIGTIQLENQGEFVAKRIKVTLDRPKRKDPVETGLNYDSSYDCDLTKDQSKCTYDSLPDDACGFTSCTGISIPETAGGKDRPYQCEWKGDIGSISPGDIKAMAFVCGQDKPVEEFEDFSEDIDGVTTVTDFRQWSPSGINKCECSDPEKPKDDPTNSINCECLEGEVIGYVYEKNYVAIKMMYEFDYDVTANGEVAIMDSTTYDEKLMRKEIRPTDSESKYSGGPVMISIWQQDQPLRSETESYATISIFNNGDGILKKGANLTVTIPKENIGSDITKISSTLLDGGLQADDPYTDLDDDYYTFKYELTAKNGLEKDKSAKFTFRFKGNLDEGVLEKTTLITAKLDYTYTREKLLEFPIALIPAQ